MIGYMFKHYPVGRYVSTLVQDFGQMAATSAKLFLTVGSGNDSC